MLSERLKTRLSKNRPMTSITLRIPVDVVDSMKSIAIQRGFSSYQTLLRLYLSDGLRKDETQLMTDSTARLFASLKKRGVAQEVLDDAARELVSA